MSKMTQFTDLTFRSRHRFLTLSIGVVCLWCSGSVEAGPNLVANGALEQPSGRAPAHVSKSENTVVFGFAGERNFGRVLVHCPGVGKEIAEEMVVAYSFVTTAGGRTRGLTINTKEVTTSAPYEITICFDLQGKIRPNTRYAYSIFPLPLGEGGSQSGVPDMEMIAPALWADGELIGASVPLSWSADDNAADTLAKRGVVRTPGFKEQTGSQSLMLKLPDNYKGELFLVRVSLREFDEALLRDDELVMPTPIRYVSIRDAIEQQIMETLTRSTDALRALQNDQGFWGSGSLDAAMATATAMEALGNRGVDLTTREMREGIEWLTEQELSTVPAVAARLSFLARYAQPEHRQTAAADLLWLSSAQFEDGGWAELSNDDNEDPTLHPDNLNTLLACLALREAHYAGLKCDIKLWRDAAKYWTEAQARDGGFREKKDEYGGLSEATTTHRTAAGLTGLLVTLDMAFAAGGRRCDQYKVNSAQVSGIQQAMEWMDEYYDEAFKTVSQLGLDSSADPFMSARMLQKLVEISGVHRFAGKDVFKSEARTLLNTDATRGGVVFFDFNTGLFAGSPLVTGQALELLSNGAAPIAVQRIIAGGTEANELSRDADHLVRYLRSQRGMPLNWRRQKISASIGELACVPVLFVNIVGPLEWDEQQWKKIRDYCFTGGVAVFNLDEEARDQQSALEQGLRTAFPEYKLKGLPSDDAIFSIKHELKGIDGIRALGNGFKNFVFVAPRDWSCGLNLNQTTEHASTFEFLDNLLEYTRDGTPPRSSFEPSPWDVGAATNVETHVTRMEIGADLPLWPDAIKTLDRAMQAGYRLKVHQSPPEDVTDRPSMLWLARGGDAALTDEDRQVLQTQIDAGTFIFAEVLDGRPGWLEAMIADLQSLDPGIRVRKLLANHPVMTGYIEGTQGYDVRQVALRKALSEEYEKLPRPDLYVIEKDGREIGVLSAYDVSSGIEYVLYPGCRGPMPAPSREIMTNVLLYAMEKQLGLES